MTGSSPYLDPKAAARLIGMSTRRFYDLLRAGKVPGRKVGGRWRSDAEALRAHLRGHRAD